MSFLHKCISLFKKKELLYTLNIYSCVQSRVTIFCACHSLCQVQRSVAPRCGCELNAQCVMCSGRALPPADTQHQLPLLDRLAQFDPCVHPILSFTDGEDTPLSFNCLFLSFFPVCTHVCRPKQWQHQGPVFLTFLVLLCRAQPWSHSFQSIFKRGWADMDEFDTCTVPLSRLVQSQHSPCTFAVVCLPFTRSQNWL